MDEQTRERMKRLLEELHTVEYHGEEYYRIVEELEALIDEPVQARHDDESADTPGLSGHTERGGLMAQMIMERLTEMLMTGTVRTKPEAARLFRAAAGVLGKTVVDEALFDNTAQAEDERWYVTVLGEEAGR